MIKSIIKLMLMFLTPSITLLFGQIKNNNIIPSLNIVTEQTVLFNTKDKTICINCGACGVISLEIYDMLFKNIIHERFSVSNVDTCKCIEANSLGQGIYFLRIRYIGVGHGEMVKRILITNSSVTLF